MVGSTLLRDRRGTSEERVGVSGEEVSARRRDRRLASDGDGLTCDLASQLV